MVEAVRYRKSGLFPRADTMPDPLTKKERSALMGRVRQSNTDLERIVRSALHRRGYRFRKNLRSLPGSPDVVFTRAKVAVFVDGDFWHGWKFEEKKHKYKPYWQQKIAENIERDERNFAALREMGWTVIRVWQHEIKKNSESVVERIVKAVDEGNDAANG